MSYFLLLLFFPLSSMYCLSSFWSLFSSFTYFPSTTPSFDFPRFCELDSILLFLLILFLLVYLLSLLLLSFLFFLLRYPYFLHTCYISPYLCPLLPFSTSSTSSHCSSPSSPFSSFYSCSSFPASSSSSSTLPPHILKTRRRIKTIEDSMAYLLPVSPSQPYRSQACPTTTSRTR